MQWQVSNLILPLEEGEKMWNATFFSKDSLEETKEEEEEEEEEEEKPTPQYFSSIETKKM